MAEDKHSKKHPASDHKKKQLKKKGTVAKSQDVPMALGLLAAFGVLVAMKGFFLTHFLDVMNRCWQELENIGHDNFDMKTLLLYGLLQTAMLSGPVLIAVMVAGIISNVAQTGFILTGEQLKPDIKKINPMTKLKQWFSIKSLQELGKSLAKILAAAFIGYIVWKGALTSIISSVLVDGSLQDQAMAIITLAGKIVSTMFWKILILYIVVAGIDFAFQRKNFTTEHKMTDIEVRDEYKQQEGDPYMKQKRRQMAQQVAMQQSTEYVPQSDVVVINPTELAIAIKYDPQVSPVPYVMSKGDKRHADEIRESARMSGIPVVRNKPLARALFEMCEIGDIVPEDLYRPVAEVLAYVFALKEETGVDATASQQQAAPGQQTVTAPSAIHDLGTIPVPRIAPAGSHTAAGAPAVDYGTPADRGYGPPAHTQLPPTAQPARRISAISARPTWVEPVTPAPRVIASPPPVRNATGFSSGPFSWSQPAPSAQPPTDEVQPTGWFAPDA
jgi:flagellar biosynthesis protein FlhB